MNISKPSKRVSSKAKMTKKIASAMPTMPPSLNVKRSRSVVSRWSDHLPQPTACNAYAAIYRKSMLPTKNQNSAASEDPEPQLRDSVSKADLSPDHKLSKCLDSQRTSLCAMTPFNSYSRSMKTNQ